MQTIQSLDALEALYGEPAPASLSKVCRALTPAYRRWIEGSRFLILSTVGPDGTDGSPRGDDEPVVEILDDTTLLLPDWRGNNRMDSLRNIVTDGRVSLMFMVPGSNEVVRVNGQAVLTADADVTARFERKGKTPKTVVVITLQEIYFQCAKALMRSRLWRGEDLSKTVPSAGALLGDASAGFDANAFNKTYIKRAEETMW
ncbi:MAG: pyridoxamine 5'-phosphate oxidase family protein [Pseudomonadota bacterium]